MLRPAWREALALTKAWFCHLLAVHVAEKAAAVPQAHKIIEKLRGEADQEGIPLDTLVLQGSPHRAIMQAAQARGTDLFILGSHVRSGLTRFFTGSVAQEIIGQARCPVLVVKSGDTFGKSE